MNKNNLLLVRDICLTCVEGYKGIKEDERIELLTNLYNFLDPELYTDNVKNIQMLKDTKKKLKQIQMNKNTNKEKIKPLNDMSCVELKRYILDRKEEIQNGK